MDTLIPASKTRFQSWTSALLPAPITTSVILAARHKLIMRSVGSCAVSKELEKYIGGAVIPRCLKTPKIMARFMSTKDFLGSIDECNKSLKKGIPESKCGALA